MPKARYRGRGKLLRYRTVKAKGGYVRLAVFSRRGKHGGHTVGTYHRAK